MPIAGHACTTAVISPGASAPGRPLLWKNRDTDFLNNKVIFVNESPFSYLALVNAEDRSGRWVYAGLNSAGFAIFNSVAYNLPENKRRDEGYGRDHHGRRPAPMLERGRI